jgi:predicted amidophosphoribosyltransferase
MFLGSRCTTCDRPGPALCDTCAHRLIAAPPLAPRPPLRSCTGLVSYEGTGRQLVMGIKYRNERGLVGRLGRRLAQQVAVVPFDVVTWAPTSPARRRQRGFDQAELLARAVARGARRPCQPLLRRAQGPPQTGRSAVERETGPRFDALPCAGRAVLVVDDVATTGATLATAGEALLAAGARRVDAAVLALTPPSRRLVLVGQGSRDRHE